MTRTRGVENLLVGRLRSERIRVFLFCLKKEQNEEKKGAEKNFKFITIIHVQPHTVFI